jgi:RecB family endonuclease NucS
MASRAAEEDMELVGGADDCDDDAEILPRPSRKAALEAAATLERYINLIQEPYARKLEGLLFTFGHQTQTRNMVPTLMTDYFH